MNSDRRAHAKTKEAVICIDFLAELGRSSVVPQNPDHALLKSQPPIGIWEAQGRNGGAIGINLWEVTASRGHGWALLKSGEKDYPVLQIGVYERSKARVQCLEENFFDTGWQGVTSVYSKYADGRLIIHVPANYKGVPRIDIELAFDPQGDAWTGRFHRGTFDENTTLSRAQDRPSHDQELCLGQEENFPAPQRKTTDR